MPKSLVLIVGAGASFEVDLPIGNQLRAHIANALDIRYRHGREMISGDAVINGAFRILAKKIDPFIENINPFLETSWRIRDAMPQAISIDNFIHCHRNDPQIAICGKLAIARCILEAEAKSKLYVDPRDQNARINFSNVEGTWFNSFFQLVTENCQVSEIDQQLARVSIISFNYDRCIEHYLHSALQNYYGITSARATEAMANLSVFHPYGLVGQLPWQTNQNGVSYGGELYGQQLINISEGLKTFTEGIDPDHSDIMEIRSELEGAEKIAFLGFAFHPLNLRLLFPGLSDGQKIKKRSAYATGYGISNADIQTIRNELHQLGAVFNEQFYFRNDLTCSMLFREFWRSLSLQ